MKVAIHQPQFLPWLGYFDKMDQADVCVLLDDVKFKKNELQNRNKIRTAKSWQWLTVPVHHEHGQIIKEVRIDESASWRSKHIKAIEKNYSKARYMQDYFRSFCELFMVDWDLLVRLNICLIIYFKDVLGIETELVRSSSLHVDLAKTDRLLEICRILGADIYISEEEEQEYCEEEKFLKKGIEVEYHKYKHPEYKQAHPGFESHMSVLDLLFCHGSESLKIIRKGRRK